MNLRRLFICILMIVTVFLTLACNSTSSSEISQPSVTYAYLPIQGSVIITPISKLGETAELTFTVNVDELWKGQWRGHNVEDLAQSRAWIEFSWTDIHGSYSAAKGSVQIPLPEVMADGELTWEGNALENRNITLHGTFQLPKEGIWVISGYFSGANWEEPVASGREIAVADGIVVDMGTMDLKTSPLAYLSVFPYGMGGKQILREETSPVILELDINKPPLVGEEVLVSCRITSLHDVPDFSAQITFENSSWKKLNTPISDILVSGSLEWQGNLKTLIPIEFSAIIRCQEEGEWRVFAEGNTQERKSNHMGGWFDFIEITTSASKAYYGWEEKIINFIVPPDANTTTPAT